MSREDFYKLNDDEFLKNGFKRDNDPDFWYSMDLCSEEDLKDDEGVTVIEMPQLLYGNTGINSGYCIYTGTSFIWFRASTPTEAIEFSEKIVAIEEV